MTKGSRNTGDSNDPWQINSFDGDFAAAYVHYIGFEGIVGERRLTFRVKSPGHSPLDVTCDIPDAAFSGTSRLLIQDAAPMAYEKLVELLTREQTFEAATFFLTPADIENYITRHASHRGRSAAERTKQTERPDTLAG
jgi:hypothetical protein